MLKTQTPTYHLAPNFSIAPYPSGPITLGSILPSLSSTTVLNTSCHYPIPDSQLYCHHKRGFRATRSQLRGGECSVWARFIGVEGLGGKVGGKREAREVAEFRFAREDTVYFDPTREYVEGSMGEEDVKEYVEGAGWDPVFMVTGLKIAHKPSVKIMSGGKREAGAEIGGEQIAGLPIGVGGRMKAIDEGRVEVGWEESDDFLVGIRVKKLLFKRAWGGFGKRGRLMTEDWNKGAGLVDNSEFGKADDDEDGVVEVVADEELEGKDGMRESGEGGDTSWIVPRFDDVK